MIVVCMCVVDKLSVFRLSMFMWVLCVVWGVVNLCYLVCVCWVMMYGMFFNSIRLFMSVNLVMCCCVLGVIMCMMGSFGR